MTPEEENTFRALKDLPLTVTSFWCRVGWHRWTRWGDKEKLLLANEFRLSRYCIHCHLPNNKLYKEAW